MGILNYLDDAWGGMGNSAEKDVNFAKQIHKSFGNDTKKPEDEPESSRDYFVSPKFGSDRQFIVIHFAGEVRPCIVFSRVLIL